MTLSWQEINNLAKTNAFNDALLKCVNIVREIENIDNETKNALIKAILKEWQS